MDGREGGDVSRRCTFVGLVWFCRQTVADYNRRAGLDGGADDFHNEIEWASEAYTAAVVSERRLRGAE